MKRMVCHRSFHGVGLKKKLAGRRPARESLFGFMGSRKERGGEKITPPFF
jgi:hypothetical protein